MPPQSQAKFTFTPPSAPASSAATASDYSDQDIIKVLASPEFKAAPAELQLEVRRRLGLLPAVEVRALGPGEFKPNEAAPVDRRPITKPNALDWLFGTLGNRPLLYQHNTALESLERSMRETAARREREDAADPTRTMAGRAFRQYSPRTMADVAGFTRSALQPKNLAISAVSLAVPITRPFIGAYLATEGGKEALTPRKPEETSADYLQRILFGLSGVAGGAALGKSGRLRSAKSELESRINRLSYASGAEPGTPAAYRMTLPDLIETARLRKMPLRTIEDVARVVEATNERFNTQMALAEQPFARDTVLPRRAADALRAAADEMAPSQAHEAAELRNLAKGYDRPMTLRDLGREVRHQNNLYRTHAGKTSLELSTAKTRANVAANDILRKSLRDIYMDYLESKYQGGGGLRDMRVRQEQVLKLRETLGEFNRRTGQVERGHVERLKSEQAKFKGGPAGADVHGSASPHGVRGYLKLPRSLRRGPETQANRAVRRALRDEPGHRLPTRKLNSLTRRPEGESPVDEMTRRGPGAPPEKDHAAIAEEKQQQASLKRQMEASKRHPEWQARVRAKVRAAEQAAEGESAKPSTKPEAKSGSATSAVPEDKEAAALKREATPAADTGHLDRATEELFPGKKFHHLTTAEQSRAIQRALELKFGKSKKPSAKEEP